MDKDNLKKLGALFELTNEYVFGIANGVIQFANPAAVARFGGRLIGSPASSLIPEHVLTEQADSFVSTAIIDGEALSVAASRLETSLLLTVSRDDDSLVHGIRLSGALSSLNSNMATLRIAADKLLGSLDMKADPKLEAYAAVLNRNYYMLLRTVKSISDVIAISEGDAAFSPRPTDMDGLCSDIADSVNCLAHDLGVRIEYSSDGGDLTAMLDQERIERLVLNLISNCINHMENGGTIRLELMRQKDRLVLTISDPGDGMSAGTLRAAFTNIGTDPAQYLAGGAGLGLAMARKTAELHGGAVIMSSSPGMGATIKVLLPLDSPHSPARFHSSDAGYRDAGITTALMELSTVLPGKFYSQAFCEQDAMQRHGPA